MQLQGSCHCKAVQFSLQTHTPYPFMQCYCSICRKSAGGGGYAINIMGLADTLKIKGNRNVQIYRARMKDKKGWHLSSTHRHFCKKCASTLWISDPQWPQWVYPFASAIDTSLPKPPARVHMMLNYVADWVEVPKASRKNVRFKEYPKESIMDWHKRLRLLVD